MPNDSRNPKQKTRVVIVGVGGATCSGKTTLAKHLKRILPDSIIIHQDDFTPPEHMIPIHPVYNVQDWDAAPGAIEWPRLIEFLQQVKETGEIPLDHQSHDHLNIQEDIKIDEEVRDKWTSVFEKMKQEREDRGGEKIVWGLVDGFLLYWHQDVIDQLDVPIFLRVPEEVLKRRRETRNGYFTSDGSLWRDPPNYWEQIVYPAYVEANRDVFENGDVKEGRPTDKVKKIVLVENMGMSEIVERCCTMLKMAAE